MRFFTTLLLAVLPLISAVPISQAPAGAEVVPDRYIVVLKQGTTSKQLQARMEQVAQRMSTMKTAIATGGVSHQYDFNSLKGFAGHFDPATIDEISKQRDVAYVERDAIVRVSEAAGSLVTQEGVPYGLARISHKTKNATDYVYDSSAGAGTFAYIIDTGVYIQHSLFEGRASWGANFAANSSDTDNFGHGTHVAGTIASSLYGVSKKAEVIAVKVLGDDGSGTNSDVISGIQWAANDAVAKKRVGKAVANMSLGGSYSKAVNDAVDAAVSAGLFMAVAAGNENENASTKSPASAKSACTVGAIDSTDARAYYSNYGKLVDVFAPGSDVLSTYIGSPDATKKLSGTSMATPHVAGLGAYILGLKSIAPEKLCDYIVSTSLKGVVSDPGSGSPNLLINNGNGL